MSLFVNTDSLQGLKVPLYLLKQGVTVGEGSIDSEAGRFWLNDRVVEV